MCGRFPPQVDRFHLNTVWEGLSGNQEGRGCRPTILAKVSVAQELLRGSTTTDDPLACDNINCKQGAYRNFPSALREMHRSTTRKHNHPTSSSMHQVGSLLPVPSPSSAAAAAAAAAVLVWQKCRSCQRRYRRYGRRSLGFPL